MAALGNNFFIALLNDLFVVLFLASSCVSCGKPEQLCIGQWLPRTLWAQGQGLPFPAPEPSVRWDHGGLVSETPLHLSIKWSFFCSQRIELSTHFKAMEKQAESFFSVQAMPDFIDGPFPLH